MKKTSSGISVWLVRVVEDMKESTGKARQLSEKIATNREIIEKEINQ